MLNLKNKTMEPKRVSNPQEYVMNPGKHEAINKLAKMPEVLNRMNAFFEKFEEEKVILYEDIAEILFEGKYPFK
jgi:hypothetical protein